MKIPINRVMLAAMSFFLVNCSEKTLLETNPLPPVDYNSLCFEHSMKGWELYSRPNGNDWNYSVIVGSNILKTYNMVIGNPVSVTGTGSLKKILEHMPEGEEIVWIGEGWLSQIWTDGYRDLMLPPEDIILEINQYCQENGLLLIIVY
jgi:hypothetical protein